MNQDILDELERLREQYDEFGDVTREKAYSRAIDSVKAHAKQIMSGKDAMTIKWIGKGIGWRIDQVLGTDTVGESDAESEHSQRQSNQRQSNQRQSNQRQSNQRQSNQRQSNQHKDNGNKQKPLKKTTKKPENLSPSLPKIKAIFVDQRGPSPPRTVSRETSRPVLSRETSRPALSRETATQLLGVVRNILTKINPDAHVSLTDTYRRGHTNVPVLVFLLTDRNSPRTTDSSRCVMAALVDQLQRAGILFNTIQNRDANVVHGRARFHSGQIVPLYFVCVCAQNWPYALLRYTGPSDVWQQLVQAAAARGLTLTEHGLYQNGQPIRAQNEKHVFRLLNVEYLEPESRG